MLKKILGVVLILVVFIQFVRPFKNTGSVTGPDDIHHVLGSVPTEVQTVLEKACYDCHSNHTNYPWYTNIQPIGWWMQHHVNEGKAHLNFSEMRYAKKGRLAHKLSELADEVADGKMPIPNYTRMHKLAMLSDAEKQLLINWANAEKLKAERAEANL